MTLDAETTARIVEETAARLTAEIKAQFGDLSQIILIDLATAAQCLGITRKQAGAILPTVRPSPRYTAVRLSDLKDHISAGARKS